MFYLKLSIYFVRLDRGTLQKLEGRLTMCEREEQ